MIDRKDFKPGETRPGVNINGLFASELPRAEFLRQSFKLIEDLAFKGIEYAQLWVPWPLTEFGNYSKIMRNRMMFNSPWHEMNKSINGDFLEGELMPVIRFMLKCNITLVLNVGGYTRAQVVCPVEWPIEDGYAYSNQHLVILLKIVSAIRSRLSDTDFKKIIFKASNEPYAFPAPRNCDHKTAVEIIYKMTQFHARFKRDSMKLFNLTDENFAFDVTYGYDRKTGKQWPIHNAGMTLGHLRGKYNVLEMDLDEIEKIEEKEVNMQDTWSITEFHQISNIFDIYGRAGDMGKHENFTGIMEPAEKGTGEKYIRKAHIFFTSLDGVKPRLTGSDLHGCTKMIVRESKKRNKDRMLVHFFHPTSQYVIPSKDEHTHRWDFEKFDMKKEVTAGILGFIDVGMKLPNRGKKIIPPAPPESEEPTKPTLPGDKKMSRLMWVVILLLATIVVYAIIAFTVR